MDTIFEPVVIYGTMAVGFVVISTLALGALVAMIIEVIPDEVRAFKAWVRRTYRWVRDSLPAWRDQVHAWRHRTFGRMWV